MAGKAQIWDAVSGQGCAEDLNVGMENVETRKSLYVEIFENMQSIVLEHEKFLFSQSEIACFERIQALSYPARYLLIRLCLRKRDKWHTLASLETRYRSEIGDKERISTAIDELCGIQRADATTNVKEPDVIDLTLEEDEGEASKDSASSITQAMVSHPTGDLATDELSRFAADDTMAPLSELLACISVDELKSIAKQLKVARTAQTRTALIDAILSNASQQSTLDFLVLTPRNNTSGASMRHPTLNFQSDGKKATQHTIVRRLVRKSMSRCVRIESAVFGLFDRLNLVFFRSTTHSPSLLLPALLTAFRKRRYGSIEYSRTGNIFPSRDSLVAYEEALLLEYRVDEAFGGNDDILPQKSVRTILSKGSRSRAKGKEKAEEGLATDSSRVEGARVVRQILEKVYDRWISLISREDEEEKAGLERFDCGHVLTRIVYKGVQALAILKEYPLEMEVLEKLLNQGKWRRGRRGVWYDRLALVLMTHCERSQENLEKAMEVVIRGLEDDFTHMIYRPRLERRLTRLENMLKIPNYQRHKCDGQLQKAEEVCVEGVRIYRVRSASITLDESDRVECLTMSPFPEHFQTQTPLAVSTQSTVEKGKTIWVGRRRDEVSVEHLALEYYEDMGFKGFHSEGSIVSTIFGLLFWDIIFASIPGAFETPYQTAPLDIHEDGFYSARRELIGQRLGELEDGQARDIIRRVDERERPAQTLCIGVDWTFERDDLLEVANCLGGHALAIICRMICEDYSQWRGGVPDLFVWNAQAGTCKFVEVKSPNDTLSENQKVWIDVLLGSGTSVDLCHVTEKGKWKKSKKSHGRKKKPMVDPSVFGTKDGMELESAGHHNILILPPGEVKEGKTGRKRHYDSDFMIPKKRKVETMLTPRMLRKG